MPGLLYADNLVLCGESEEDLRAIVGHFIAVCGRSMKQCSKVVVSGRGGVAGAIRSLVNARSLELQCARVSQESLMVPVRGTRKSRNWKFLMAKIDCNISSLT